MKQNLDRVKEQFAALLQLNSQDQKIYLVGGVVRDQILDRKKNDVDVLCEKDSRSVAKRWADAKLGAFFVLDEQRKTYRVILSEAGQKSVYDFAAQQGRTLEEDLAARDFTLNAMAIEFSDPDTLIDPLGGLKDIERGFLCACSQDSFRSDPVRTIRAIRYAHAFQLQIEPATFQLLGASVPDLDKISGERKRDELFKILDLPTPAPAIATLQEMGILAKMGFPALSPENLRLTNELSVWLNQIAEQQISSNLVEAALPFEGLSRYLADYRSLLTQKNTSDRNPKQLVLLMALLLGVESGKVHELALHLLLSNEELSRLMTWTGHQRDFDSLLPRSGELTDRDFYLFFSPIGVAGLELALLGLVQQGASLERKKAALLADKIFSYWFERQNVLNPQLLMNGREIMMSFDLSSGPEIGRLLDCLKEEQAAGTIQTREQALIWMEEQVNQVVDQRRWERSRRK